MLLVTSICIINHISQNAFNAHRCAQRLLVDKLQLDTVTKPHEFWEYLERFNEEVYSEYYLLFTYIFLKLTIYIENIGVWKTLRNDSKDEFNYQLLLSNENFILGFPRLRQIRIDNSHCQIIQSLSMRPVCCYAPYHKSKEYRAKFITVTGAQYEYTLPKITDALKLSNAYGPYDTGGFMYYFRPTKDSNDKGIQNLKKNAWLDISTRAIFIELILFNPNTELLTSINILFEFLTTGKVNN